jgi:hypothetical protein
MRERYNKFVPERPDDGCWLWVGNKNPQGYGYFSVENKGKRATHVALFLETGEWPPKGVDVCHRCDNPSCVRPDHLFIGTRRENMRDCVKKGRNANTIHLIPKEAQVRGSKHPRAKLNEEAVRRILSSGERAVVLAERYGVRRNTINQIRAGKAWNHVHGNEIREKIARAICQARCVGNQKPDDPMGVLFTSTGTEATPPYRWQTHLPEADAVLALYAPVMEENERFKGALPIFEHVTYIADTLSCDVPVTAEVRQHIKNAYETLAALRG